MGVWTPPPRSPLRVIDARGSMQVPRPRLAPFRRRHRPVGGPGGTATDLEDLIRRPRWQQYAACRGVGHEWLCLAAQLGCDADDQLFCASEHVVPWEGDGVLFWVELRPLPSGQLPF